MNKKLFIGAIFLPIVTLFFLIYYNKNYLPISYILNDLADVLLIDEIATDVLDGAELSDFRLTQAPYYFPDILFATVLKIFDRTASVSISFYFFGWLAGAIGWFYFLKLSLKANFETAVFAGLVYFFFYHLSFTTNPDVSQLAMFWGLIGHHSSVGIAMPYCLMAISGLLKIGNDEGAHNRQSLLAAASVFFLLVCVLSDRLFITGLLAPLLTMLVANCFYRIHKKLAVKNVSLLIVLCSVVLVEQIFTKNIAYPQTYEFSSLYLHALLKEFPISSIQSLRYFFIVLKSSVFTGLILAGWLLGSVLVFLSGCRARVLDKAITANGILLYVMVLALGSLMTTGSQLLLGIFKDPGSLRQLAGLSISTIVAVSAYFFARLPKNFTVQLAIIAIAWLGLMNFSKNSLLKSKYESYFLSKDMHNCIKYLTSNKSDFIANYWTAVPARKLTGTYGVAISDDLLTVFTNGQNIEKIRGSSPQMALTDNHLSASALTTRFGQPLSSLSCGENFNLLDYSGNAEFIFYFSSLTRAAR